MIEAYLAEGGCDIMSDFARFNPGQIVEHTRFGYRGIIAGVDPDFQLSEAWYDAVARSRPPKDQPWYHVLVDGAEHTTYVAERHLRASDDHSQIDHPLLGQYFNRYDGARYYPVQRYN
jgi:heat shock protein HspQ